MLNLQDQTPLASGSAKLVYAHPTIPGAIIKVAREQQRVKPRGLFRRLPRYWEYACQIIEYLSLLELERRNVPFLERIIGLVDTDLGVGLVVEGVWRKEGRLAYTLRDLKVRGEIDGVKRKAFEKLLHWVEETDIVIRDFSTNNSVWDDARKCFVVIDGLGVRPAFTLRSLSKRYNRRANRKKAKKLRGKILTNMAA